MSKDTETIRAPGAEGRRERTQGAGRVTPKQHGERLLWGVATGRGKGGPARIGRPPKQKGGE